MSQMKKIVFDFGNVLIRWEPEGLYRPYFKDEVKLKYFFENICNPAWNERLDRGNPLMTAYMRKYTNSQNGRTLYGYTSPVGTICAPERSLECSSWCGR